MTTITFPKQLKCENRIKDLRYTYIYTNLNVLNLAQKRVNTASVSSNLVSYANRNLAKPS